MKLELNKRTKVFKILFLFLFFYIIRNSLTLFFLIIEFFLQGNKGPINFVQMTSTPELWSLIFTLFFTILFLEIHLSANPSKIHFDRQKIYIKTAFRTLEYELCHCSCTESKFFWRTYYTIEVPGKKIKNKIAVSSISYIGYHDFFDELKIAMKYYWHNNAFL